MVSIALGWVGLDGIQRGGMGPPVFRPFGRRFISIFSSLDCVRAGRRSGKEAGIFIGLVCLLGRPLTND